MVIRGVREITKKIHGLLSVEGAHAFDVIPRTVSMQLYIKLPQKHEFRSVIHAPLYTLMHSVVYLDFIRASGQSAESP